ncbi:hypothetical protein [Clostridium sp. Cult2]|uniref:hypothetical protein n=1 Tax=Clostridium sp. Cult2 TaxID=2079003 RepID=UPI001F45B01F|nr:hypothetical protein [Clostridium sp. Cult2]MCF6464915.1 hypothetical protein [Clostridium sp. Cult2]
MNWNKIDSPVKHIYGKLDLGFTPIFNETVKVFKNWGYKRILDIILQRLIQFNYPKSCYV